MELKIILLLLVQLNNNKEKWNIILIHLYIFIYKKLIILILIFDIIIDIIIEYFYFSRTYVAKISHHETSSISDTIRDWLVSCMIIHLQWRCKWRILLHRNNAMVYNCPDICFRCNFPFYFYLIYRMRLCYCYINVFFYYYIFVRKIIKQRNKLTSVSRNTLVIASSQWFLINLWMQINTIALNRAQLK